MRGKQSPETIAKRVATLRASGVYTKNGERMAALNRSRAGQPLPAAQKAYIAAAMKGKQNCLGHKPSESHRRALAEYWAANREKHNHYLDGRGNERRQARHQDMSRLEYRLWREAVFARDDWTCVLCGARGGQIQADHIKPYAHFPDIRLDVSNGRTLCVPCHKKQPTTGFHGRRPQSAPDAPMET